MNEKQYKSICESCDEILSESDYNSLRVGIPWFHIIREHPVSLGPYTQLLDNSTDATSKEYYTTLWHSILSIIVQFLRSILAQGKMWCAPTKDPKFVDIILISHLLEESSATQISDFYYGNLPDHLSKNGYSVVVGFVNQTNISSKKLFKKMKMSNIRKLIFTNTLTIFEEIKLSYSLIGESRNLRKLAKNEHNILKKKILISGSVEALNTSAFSSIRLGIQIGSLVAKYKPKLVILTHEGHAWERMAFASIRKSFPEAKCAGYIHAAIFRLQHAIRRPLEDRYNPDYIFTSGSIAQNQLESYSGNLSIPKFVLGSPRAQKKIRQSNLENFRIDGNSGRCVANTVLVVPEGLIGECNILFNFAIECAILNPQIDFILRLHPSIKFENLTSQNLRLKTPLKNIFLSRRSLSEDINSSRWVLYRGSTAVIQAAVKGLIPIYLKINNEMTIDPLYELGEKIIKIENPTEFLSVVKANETNLENLIKINQNLIKDYCEKFYEDFNYDLISKLIRNDIIQKF